MDVHGFEEDNITVLMDDGEHLSPTKENILNAYKKIIAETEATDAVFLHYSGHGTKLRDDDHGEEADGYDEALVPLDFNDGAGMIRDDDLYDILVKPLAQGAHMVSLVSRGQFFSLFVKRTLLVFSLSHLSFPKHFRWIAATVVPFWTCHTFSRLTDPVRKCIWIQLLTWIVSCRPLEVPP